MTKKRKLVIHETPARVSSIECSLGTASLLPVTVENGHLVARIEVTNFDKWVEAEADLVVALNGANPNCLLELCPTEKVLKIRPKRPTCSAVHLASAAGGFLREVQVRSNSGVPSSGNKRPQAVHQYFNGTRVWGPEQRAAFRARQEATG